MENGSIERGSAADLTKFQIERNVMSLCKNFLIVLEDIRDGTPIDYQKQRKRVLDAGNNAIREIESQIDLFNINYK